MYLFPLDNCADNIYYIWLLSLLPCTLVAVVVVVDYNDDVVVVVVIAIWVCARARGNGAILLIA